jgi:hypothetical protein
MRTRNVCFWVIVLGAFIAASYARAAVDEKVVVFNPRGIQPDIRKIPMAMRSPSLDGQTVYVVDIKYAMTRPFVNELMAALKAKYPSTNWVLKEKTGMYMDDDPKLWAEIKEKAAGAIVLVGH